jgi:hypothetical protein
MHIARIRWRRPTAARPTLQSRRKGARGYCCYRWAIRSCTGRQRAGCWATVGPLHRLGIASGAAARGRRLEAATTWPGGFTLISGGQYGWFRCSGKLGCNGGRCARSCAATGAVRQAPSISTRLGRPTDRSAARCACVETRTRDRASMGVGQVGMEDG